MLREKAKNKMADSWARVLVLRFSSIGDIIQTTSVLNTIKKYFPDTEIEYLTLKNTNRYSLITLVLIFYTPLIQGQKLAQ